MRADATHRFEFEVDGGRRPPFVCLARTRSEAEQIARHAGAPARLRSRRPVELADGDAAARDTVLQQGLLRHPWRDDMLQIVAVLDHVRHSSDAMSVVPVAFLPLAVIAARGLRPCATHERVPPGQLHPVQAPAGVLVQMIEDGGWDLHLWQERERPREGDMRDWERCDCGALGLAFRAATPVWVVAHRVLVTLMLVSDLRPGELSAVPIPLAELRHG